MKRTPRQHLISTYPELEQFFESVEIPDSLSASGDPTPHAVLRTVIGQMLSTSVARTIHERVIEKASLLQLEEAWMLDSDSLRECGLSRNKCRAIIEFRDSYMKNPDEIDQWCTLSWEGLRSVVKRNWGMSDWTAGILGIFHFGHTDIFPAGDGSLRRALACLRDKYPTVVIEPNRCRPYRSFLALALWSALDNNVI